MTSKTEVAMQEAEEAIRVAGEWRRRTEHEWNALAEDCRTVAILEGDEECQELWFKRGLEICKRTKAPAVVTKGFKRMVK